MPEEKGTHNEQISDGAAKLDAVMDMIRDACAKMDEGSRRLDARMDAMEENFRKMDSAKKDEDEEEEKKADRKDADFEEEKGEPKEPAADKRKDSEGEKQKEGYVEDRKDADDEDEDRKDEDEDEKAKADTVTISRAELDSIRGQIAALQTRVPSLLSDSDRERFAAIQEQADSAFQAFGDRAPGPLDGETPTQYKRRLGAKLQKHSPKWKDTRLSAIADDATLDTVVNDVYADAISAARRGVEVPAGHLREVSRQVGGHTIIEFEGDASSWMNGFAGNSQRGTGTWLRPH